MPFLAAAAPAITAISGLASAGAGVGSAIAQGQNPGTQPLDPNVGQLNPAAFGYGGGIRSQAQDAAQGALASTEQANMAAQQEAQRLQQEIAQAHQDLKDDPFKLGKGKDAGARLMRAMQQMPAAMQKAGKANEEFQKAKAAYDAAPNLAASEANRFGGIAQGARDRAPVQADLTGFNKARGAFDNDQNVAQSMALLQGAANGTAPSAAQATLQKGLDASNAGAASLAASARGGGGNLALAGLQAGQQQAQNSAAAGQDAAILRANEMAQARSAFSQGALSARAQQLQAAGLDAQTAMQQAQLELSSRQQSAQEAMGYEGLRQNAYGAQQQGAQSYQTNRARNQIDVATGNRSAQNEGFQNEQHAISTAFTAGGQAMNGLTNLGSAYGGGAKPAPGSKGAYGGGTWVRQADGNYGYQNNK